MANRLGGSDITTIKFAQARFIMTSILPMLSISA
jgi:hypothetical protein